MKAKEASPTSLTRTFCVNSGMSKTVTVSKSPAPTRKFGSPVAPPTETPPDVLADTASRCAELCAPRKLGEKKVKHKSANPQAGKNNAQDFVAHLPNNFMAAFIRNCSPFQSSLSFP